MNILEKGALFHRKPRSNLYRVFFWICLILGGIWLIRQAEQGAIKPLFLPTATPTRTAQSYALEGDAQFTAGKLDAAITAYREAVGVEPSNAEVWAKLARIQAYSASLLTTDAQRRTRLGEALDSVNQAVTLAPDSSTIHAMRAFVLDWNANPALAGAERAQDLITEAEQEAVRALQLDNQNTLALAFYAEILVDQQKWSQAEQYIKQAVERDPSLMDVHRIYAYVLESQGQYNLAIQEYDKALAIEPNLTFLYLSAGRNYRSLAFKSGDPQRAQLYERALEYFAKAARLNDQLEIRDPIPYLAIAKTYTQQGEFFIAARNALKALEIDPSNPDIYGQLGEIYQRSRNYEGAIPTLKCAVRGCTAEESCEVRGGCGEGETGVAVTGLPLSPSSANYYLIYGALLAAFSPREPSYCAEAEDVLTQLLSTYGDDLTIANNANESLAICADVAVSLSQTPTPIPASATTPSLGP